MKVDDEEEGFRAETVGRSVVLGLSDIPPSLELILAYQPHPSQAPQDDTGKASWT
jgi:hypothetical protein